MNGYHFCVVISPEMKVKFEQFCNNINDVLQKFVSLNSKYDRVAKDIKCMNDRRPEICPSPEYLAAKI